MSFPFSKFSMINQILMVLCYAPWTERLMSEQGIYPSVRLGSFVKGFHYFGLNWGVEVSYECHSVKDVTWVHEVKQRNRVTCFWLSEIVVMKSLINCYHKTLSFGRLINNRAILDWSWTCCLCCTFVLLVAFILGYEGSLYFF